jgi:hypothetical protein
MEEFFKDIEGYEGLYQVSNLGRVKSLGKVNGLTKSRLKKEKILKFGGNGKGYMMVSLWKDKKESRKLIHRLVAKAFIINKENKPYVNHLDGIKNNNNVENLKWVTASENTTHAFSFGLNKSVKIIDSNTGIIYQSIKEASSSYLISAEYLGQMLRGIRKNKTTLQYYTEASDE